MGKIKCNKIIWDYDSGSFNLNTKRPSRSIKLYMENNKFTSRQQHVSYRKNSLVDCMRNGALCCNMRILLGRGLGNVKNNSYACH